MENKIKIIFAQEKKEIVIDIEQPDLANLIHRIVSEHLDVSKDNLSIETDNNEFDKEEFKELLIEVHDEFCNEIDLFYENIQSEIKTYYDDEELSKIVIERIKESI